MNTHELCAYLTRLLGRPVASNDLVSLSSGQRARLSGWLTERGVPTAHSRAYLGAAFRPSVFFGEDFPLPPPVDAVPLPFASEIAGGAPAVALKIGIDIQLISELFDAAHESDLKADAELKNMFTLREISYAQSRPNPLETLAGIFAAKEALRKCDPALVKRSLRALEVLPDALGRPEYPGHALSISHSGGFAIAVAAALSEPPFPTHIPLANDTSGGTPEHASSAKEQPGRLKPATLTAALVLTIILIGSGMLYTFGVGR